MAIKGHSKLLSLFRPTARPFRRGDGRQSGIELSHKFGKAPRAERDALANFVGPVIHPHRPHLRGRGAQRGLREHMSDQEQATLRLQVARLRQEHADFNAAIDAMETVGCDRLQVQRMKKKKLAIRDRLQDLEDQVLPDIIA